MIGKFGKSLVLALLTGMVLILVQPVHADETSGTKPPIVVKQGNKTYIFTTQDEKFRQVLLRSKNLRIHNRRDERPEDYYRNYYRHHRYIRDHEKTPNDTAYHSGRAAGYLLSRD